MFKRKKITEKMKTKKLNGNISLLVILVLLASSVIALLSINQIQHLITYWNMTFNYFRSYYLAKAWTELWLTEVYNRDSWFESQVESGDAIVTENLVWDYAGFNPYFTMNIKANFDALVEDVRFGCEDGNRIRLVPWDWVVVPLFKDVTAWTNNILNSTNWNLRWLTESQIKRINFKYFFPNNSNLMFWFFVFDENQDMSYIEVKTWTNLSNFLNNLVVYDWDQKYLTIKNASNDDVEICVGWENGQILPYSDALVTVQANYADMEVWLQSVVKRKAPSWSLNVLWNY